MLQMVQNCGKLMNALNSERKGSFHRLLGELFFPAEITKSGMSFSVRAKAMIAKLKG